jgi:hypothetical protein
VPVASAAATAASTSPDPSNAATASPLAAAGPTVTGQGPGSDSAVLILVATLLVFGVVGGGLILLVAWRRRRPPEESIPARRPLPFAPDDLGATRPDPRADDEPVPLWVQRLDPEIVVMLTPPPSRMPEPALHRPGDPRLPEPQAG